MTDPKSPVRLLWLCGIPKCLERDLFPGRSLGAVVDLSWIVAHLPPPPGIELHLACPAKGLAQAVQLSYLGATFHLFPSPFGSAYRAYLPWRAPFRAIYEKVRPDWVHGWGTEAGFGSGALALAGKRGVVGIQGLLCDYWPYLPKSVPLGTSLINEWVTLRRARNLVAEGDYARARAALRTSGRVEMVRHPLRREILHAAPGAEREPLALFVGHLCDRKGIADAIAAFAAAAQPSWKMVCAGSGSPREMAAARAAIERRRMGSQIVLAGPQTAAQLVEWLRRAAILLLPSYCDTGPTALKEAMAMGVWPVCYDNSGPAELIREYRWGELAPTGDIAALGRALTGAMRAQPWRPGNQAMQDSVRRLRHDLSPEAVWPELLSAYRRFE